MKEFIKRMQIRDIKLSLELCFKRLSWFRNAYYNAINAILVDVLTTKRKVSCAEIKHLEVQLEKFRKCSLETESTMVNAIQLLKKHNGGG